MNLSLSENKIFPFFKLHSDHALETVQVKKLSICWNNSYYDNCYLYVCARFFFEIFNFILLGGGRTDIYPYDNSFASGSVTSIISL